MKANPIKTALSVLVLAATVVATGDGGGGNDRSPSTPRFVATSTGKVVVDILSSDGRVRLENLPGECTDHRDYPDSNWLAIGPGNRDYMHAQLLSALEGRTQIVSIDYEYSWSDGTYTCHAVTEVVSVND